MNSSGAEPITARHAAQALVVPLVAGLVVLVALLGLIGTAIRDPKPHDIRVGVVGPDQVVLPLTRGLASNAPGTFDFTTYATEADARAGLDRRDVEGAVILAPSPRIIVSGAAGDTATTVITAFFSRALGEGGSVPVEVVHPFASGDAHGLILFFLVLAALVSTFVVQALLFARASASRAAAWLGVTAVWAALAGVIGVLAADWIVAYYDDAAVPGMIGLVALASLAVGVFIAGATRLLGAAGLGLAALVIVLLDLISSGGPAGSEILPDVYRWMAPLMPAGELYSGFRGVLYFGGAGVLTPVMVMTAWLAAGFVLLVLGLAAGRRAARQGSAAPVVLPAL